ncbi:type II toxin-antitoxin system RelE/ParE family toxin [Marinobacter sp. BSs20148]
MARVIFTMFKGDMVLLNGFIKKTQKTPAQELEKARDRKKNLV